MKPIRLLCRLLSRSSLWLNHLLARFHRRNRKVNFTVETLTAPPPPLENLTQRWGRDCQWVYGCELQSLISLPRCRHFHLSLTNKVVTVIGKPVSSKLPSVPETVAIKQKLVNRKWHHRKRVLKSIIVIGRCGHSRCKYRTAKPIDSLAARETSP